MTDLRARKSLAALALELAILTASRSGEVLNAEWSEFDLDKAIWTIPASRMKAGHAHRIPLCIRALDILKSLPKLEDNPHVFPGTAKGKPLSNMAMTMQLRRMKRDDITVHGFRSTFRDWASEQTSFRMRHASMRWRTVSATRRKPLTDAATSSRSGGNSWKRGIYSARPRKSVKWFG